jgi:hypothetical protein
MKPRALRGRSLWISLVMMALVAWVFEGTASAQPDPATCVCPSTPSAVQKAATAGNPFLAVVSGDITADVSGCDATFSSLQDAVDAASGFGANVVIGVYVGRDPANPQNHLPLVENVVIDETGLDLQIVDCHDPKIVAADPSLPVITIAGTPGDGIPRGVNDPNQPGERDIELLALNVSGSEDAGVRVEATVNGRVLLKGIIAEDNGVGVLVLGDNNEVRGSNGLRFNGVGLRVGAGGSGNIIKSNRVQENDGDGISILGNNNDLNGNTSNNNGGIGYNIDGTGNKLLSNRASGNGGFEFDIGPSNIDRGGNQANGVKISFGAGGGQFE